MVVSSISRPLPQCELGWLLIMPPCSLTLLTVTLSASMSRSPPWISTSWTTAPLLVTCRSPVCVVAGTQLAGTPVVDGVGKPPRVGFGLGAGAGAAGGVGAAERVTVIVVLRSALRRPPLAIALIRAR